MTRARACVYKRLEEANYTFLNAVNEHLYNTHSNSHFMECWSTSLTARAHRPVQIIVLSSLTERSAAVMTCCLIRGHKLNPLTRALILYALTLLSRLLSSTPCFLSCNFLLSFNYTTVVHTSWYNYTTYYFCLPRNCRYLQSMSDFVRFHFLTNTPFCRSYLVTWCLCTTQLTYKWSSTCFFTPVLFPDVRYLVQCFNLASVGLELIINYILTDSVQILWHITIYSNTLLSSDKVSNTILEPQFSQDD